MQLFEDKILCFLNRYRLGKMSKDVHLVVDAVEQARLAKKVARMKPALVLKG